MGWVPPDSYSALAAVLALLVILVAPIPRSQAQTGGRFALHFDGVTTGTVELTSNSPIGEASIREHAVAWHPAKRRYYLIADVIALDNPHHPNTYETGLRLWSSRDLSHWTLIGSAVPKGGQGTYDAHGAASPAGMAYLNGRLYVPFSGRKTPQFTERSIGLAWSSEDPEQIPWTKSAAPVSELPGEDDDPAVLVIPRDERLHLFHRTTGEGGYHIVHSATITPEQPESWPRAVPVTARPDGVRAQELTGAVWVGGNVHLFVIEQGPGVAGIQIAHLLADKPNAMFEPADAGQRYLAGQPRNLAFGGHLSPVVRDGRVVAASWTVPQAGARYGLEIRGARLDSMVDP